MFILSTTKNSFSFIKVFTKMFDDMNLIEMLYDYYYNQWDITYNSGGFYNILKNSINLKPQKFRSVKNLDNNKCYLWYIEGNFCHPTGGFRIIKATINGCGYHKSIPQGLCFYEIAANHKTQNDFYEIPADFYPAISKELEKLDNSRCILL